METIILKRKISIRDDLPFEVLDYLSDSVGLDPSLSYEEKILELKKEKTYPKIPSSWLKWTKTEWNILAMFINPHITWKIQSLVSAIDDIQKERSHRRFGIRNNENPDIGDIIDAYNQCLSFKLTMSRKTTFSDMITFITLEYVRKLSLNLLQSEIPTEMIMNSILENDMSLIKMPLERKHDLNISLNPITEWDAYCQLLGKGIDTTLANSRLVEYYNPNKDTYVSPLLQDVTLINPLRLRVGAYFNPNIPIDYYQSHTLQKMARLEGIEIGDPDFIYDELTLLSYSENFHHMLQPEVKKKTTEITLEELDEVSPNSIICYGILTFNGEDMRNSDMIGYTISELTHMFRSTQSFSRFTESNITKLYNIARGLLVAYPSPDPIYSDSLELIRTIDKIRLVIDETTTSTSKIFDSFDKDQLYSNLNELLELGMYMRGWDGKSSYPISPSDEQDGNFTEIEERVYSAMIRFKESDSNLSNIIGNLPLIEYEYGAFHKIIPNSGDGKTIRERLDIVSMGESHKFMSSCIRWSSNLIISSAYYYLMFLDRAPKEFIISQLKKIG